MAEAISPELVERMGACLRAYVSGSRHVPNTVNGKSVFIEARDIVDELPPVDLDLIEARKIAAAEADGVDKPEHWSNLTGGDDYLKGQWDHTWQVRTILAAIKRGRELEQSNA